MTTAILLASTAVLTVLALAGWAVAWWQSGVIARLTEARHAVSRPRGDAAPARPGTILVRPVNGRPPGTLPRLTEQTVPIAQTGDAPPWNITTGSFPALTQEEQDERAAFVRAQLPLHEEDATREDMELALALLRERTAADLPPAPVYGQAPVADVLKAEQEGRLAS